MVIHFLSSQDPRHRKGCLETDTYERDLTMSRGVKEYEVGSVEEGVGPWRDRSEDWRESFRPLRAS